VSFEDRQDLLGHRSARITTYYSAAELSILTEVANGACDSNRRHPELVVLRPSGQVGAITPATSWRRRRPPRTPLDGN